MLVCVWGGVPAFLPCVLATPTPRTCPPHVPRPPHPPTASHTRQGVEGFSYNYYEDLTPEDALSIVDTLKKGGKPKVSRGAHVGGSGVGGCGASGAWRAGAGVVALRAHPPQTHAHACAPPPSPALPHAHPQVGSQHRKKAEPAGAVANGKWVPAPPSPEQVRPPARSSCVGACVCVGAAGGGGPASFEGGKWGVQGGWSM